MRKILVWKVSGGSRIFKRRCISSLTALLETITLSIALLEIIHLLTVLLETLLLVVGVAFT